METGDIFKNIISVIIGIILMAVLNYFGVNKWIGQFVGTGVIEVLQKGNTTNSVDIYHLKNEIDKLKTRNIELEATISNVTTRMRNKTVEMWERKIVILSKEKKYYRVRLKNKCDEKIRVAINYQDLDNDWVTEGWWVVEPNSASLANIKTWNQNIYFYATSDEGGYWSGEGKESYITKYVSSQAFTSIDSDNLEGLRNVRKESFFHKTCTTCENGETYTQSFSCND